MVMAPKPDPIATATGFVSRRYVEALAAFVGGSVIRGQGTATSDLDLVVVVATAPPAPFRETQVFDEWIIEAFVHSRETLAIWAARDAADRKPVLAQLVTEGRIIADRGPAASIRVEMQQLLDRGPAALSNEELERLRYGISDSADDLAGGPPGLERISVVASLVNDLIRLELETAGQWSGGGKWIIRRLAELDPVLSRRLTDAAAAALTDPTALVSLAEERLDHHGGRLMHGFRADGTRLMEQWLRSQPEG